MERYKKLILDKADEIGYHRLGREMGIPPQSLNDWAITRKTAHLKSLQIMSDYFKVPVPALIMEVADTPSYDDRIIESLCRLTEEQKKRVADYIDSL